MKKVTKKRKRSSKKKTNKATMRLTGKMSTGEKNIKKMAKQARKFVNFLNLPQLWSENDICKKWTSFNLYYKRISLLGGAKIVCAHALIGSQSFYLFWVLYPQGKILELQEGRLSRWRGDLARVENVAKGTRKFVCFFYLR